MKVLVVMLALAIATGSWAFVTREAQDPDSKVDMLLQEWKGHLWNATRVFQKKWGHIERSKAVEVVIYPIVSFFRHLRDQLSPEVTEAAEMVFGVPWSIGTKAVGVLHVLLSRLRPTPEEFFTTLKTALGFYFNPILERVGPHLDPPRHILIVRMQELDRAVEEMLAQQLESLDNLLTVYFEELQGISASLESFTEQVKKQFSQGLEVVNKNLKTYLTSFLKETREYKDEFDEWVKTPVFPRKHP